jgi:hypothetical protein
MTRDRTTTTAEPSSFTAAAKRLLDDVHGAVVQRNEDCLPCFCAMELSLDDGLVRMPVYVKNISTRGYGFKHSRPVKHEHVADRRRLRRTSRPKAELQTRRLKAELRTAVNAV